MVMLVLHVSAPGHGSPAGGRAGSDVQSDPSCGCATFCKKGCVPPQSRVPVPLTVYRFTPDSVRHLADTNSGDGSGDLGFFLDRRALTARCAIDPTNERCFLAPSESILYTRWAIEVDGDYGPYSSCNPMYAPPCCPPAAVLLFAQQPSCPHRVRCTRRGSRIYRLQASLQVKNIRHEHHHPQVHRLQLQCMGPLAVLV